MADKGWDRKTFFAYKQRPWVNRQQSAALRTPSTEVREEMISTTRTAQEIALEANNLAVGGDPIGNGHAMPMTVQRRPVGAAGRQASSRIGELVARDRLGDALSATMDLSRDAISKRELIALSARLSRLERQSRGGLLSREEETRHRARISQAVLEIAAELEDFDASSVSERRTGDVSVFVSYAREDRAYADRIDQALRSAGVEVLLDRRSMGPAENIDSFIRRCIREADFTVSLVSKSALLSGWVGREFTATLGAEIDGGKRLLAGFVDDSFLDPGFRLEANATIDSRIEELDRFLNSYRQQKLDTLDLDEERNRLVTQRNQLGVILRHLKQSLVLDLRGDCFEDSLDRILSVIQKRSL